MKRYVNDGDLRVLQKKASKLRKLIRSAREIWADLEVEKGYMKTSDESIGREQKRLQKRGLTPKQRAKIKQQIQYDEEFLYCAQAESCKKNSAFSAEIWRIEAVLRELTAIYVATDPQREK
jgi:hypothetical protein